MALNRLSLIKFIELVLVIACVVLHYNSLESADNLQLFFTSAVFGGYLIIMIGLLLGFFVDTAFGRRTDMYFTVLGGVLFLAAGIMSYNYFSGRLIQTEVSKRGMWKAWAAIINGIIFFVDGVFTFRAE
ncbi:hypothetical protein PGB90_007981 [Kerria lacca]